MLLFFFFFSSRRRHTRCSRDWSSDVCSSDLEPDGSNFPTSQAPQPNFGGGDADAFVAKFDPSGSALIYSTFLGGGGGIGRAACRGRVEISGGAVSLKKKKKAVGRCRERPRL